MEEKEQNSQGKIQGSYLRSHVSQKDIQWKNYVTLPNLGFKSYFLIMLAYYSVTMDLESGSNTRSLISNLTSYKHSVLAGKDLWRK